MKYCPRCFGVVQTTQEEHDQSCTVLWLKKAYEALKDDPVATKKFDDYLDNECS